jgi:hypothetical protein
MVLVSLVCAAVFALLIYVAVKAAFAPDIPTTGGAPQGGCAWPTTRTTSSGIGRPARAQ